MKRSAEQYLNEWFLSEQRQPLIIRGARQVGKSTLVKLFAEREGLDLIEINLEKTRLVTVSKESFEISELIDEILLKSRKNLTKKSLVFFDEIQESPNLLKYLRYFYEERPDIAVVAAGSLLEIALKDNDFSFPVGRVQFYHLGPMSFSEFLVATQNDFLLTKIKQHEFSEAVVKEAKKLLAQYYYVGGMPKAVKTFVSSKSLAPVRDVQEQIIQAYIADFPKYNSRINVERVEKVFYSATSLLGRKVIWSHLDKEAKAREVRRAMELLVDARVILKCNHSSANSVPLAGEMDESIFKVYFLDIGLLNSMMRLDFFQIEEEMENNFNTKGFLAEQFVAQHLAYLNNEKRGPALFYWLRDKGSQKGEVDFVIENQGETIPVEVKAKSLGHLKSLMLFIEAKKPKNAFKVSLENYNKTAVTKGEAKTLITTLPLYAIEEIYNIARVV